MAQQRITSGSEVAASRPADLTGPQADGTGESPAAGAPSCTDPESPSDPAPTQLPSVPRRRLPSIQFTRPERRPLVLALLLSLLVHALLLSLVFGGDELGLPGLALPWRDRRIEVPDLRLVLVPARVAPPEPAVMSLAERSQRVSIDAPVAGRPAPTPGLTATAPQGSAVADMPAVKSAAQADDRPSALAGAVAATPALRAEAPDRAAPVQTPAPAMSDAQPVDVPQPVVRATPLASTSAILPAPGASSPDNAPSATRDYGEVAPEAPLEEAIDQGPARIEAARLEAEAEQAERQAAAQLEAQQQELARQDAARDEAARLEAERQELARQDAARAEAAQLEAQRQELARLDAARDEAARLEAARQATAAQEASRNSAAQEAEARREAVLRAIGRQLDEEAARRDAAASAARLPNTLPYSLSTARRARLWGRIDPNAELVEYAEAWARKIQLNSAVETVRELTRRPHTPPMVTVAVRSDGSVESVTIVVSSGVAEIDAAIRRIVESQRPYAAFQPALAREFDVIEIRRTWHFDSAIRMH